MRSRLVIVGVVLAGFGGSVVAQLPLTSQKASGQTVTPAYEGWYKNADGSFTMSFGYYNRNSSEVVEIPIGPSNFVSPGDPNQGQPSAFQPDRHWGVFGVRVPADFGKKEVTWTLKFRGATYAIPGMLHPNWQIDALEGDGRIEQHRRRFSSLPKPVLKGAARAACRQVPSRPWLVRRQH
jgi:hypothetical protein